jgi:hypothetical protein
MLAAGRRTRLGIFRLNNGARTPAVVRAPARRGAAVLAIGCLLTVSASVFAVVSEHHEPGRSVYKAPRAAQAPAMDGVVDEDAWGAAPWRAIDVPWLGEGYDDDDFQGRFKVVWTTSRIYLLVEIVDDVLRDTHRDPLVQYWDDDCLEIFIDEDYSGGDHQFNHNAFAYHLSLDNRAIDIGTDRRARDYSHHVESRWRQHGNRVVWEVAIDVYADDYVDGADDNEPVALHEGKVIGLMVAYCDNDWSELREHFVGSETVPTGPKDRGWIDAGLFGALVLEDE